MTSLANNTIKCAAFFGALLLSASGFSASYDFGVSYDGTTKTDVGTDPIIGTALAAGDNFSYTVMAVGDGFWQVDTGGNFFPFLAFTIAEPGFRTGNLTLDLLLNGTPQITQLVETSAENSYVHLGTNTVPLTAGLTFNKIVLTYDLLESLAAIDNPNYGQEFEPEFIPGNANVATIADLSIGPEFPGGFGAGISYNSPSAVPLPAAAWLFGSALFGLVGVARRKQA